jgi:hypothetical protein
MRFCPDRRQLDRNPASCPLAGLDECFGLFTSVEILRQQDWWTRAELSAATTAGPSKAVKQFAQEFVREAMSLQSALDRFPSQEEPMRRSSEARRLRSVILDSTSLR